MTDLRKRIITEEEYNNAMNKTTWREKEKCFFDDSIIEGYGLYSFNIYHENDEYFIKFCIGSTCD